MLPRQLEPPTCTMGAQSYSRISGIVEYWMWSSRTSEALCSFIRTLSLLIISGLTLSWKGQPATEVRLERKEKYSGMVDNKFSLCRVAVASAPKTNVVCILVWARTVRLKKQLFAGLLERFRQSSNP